MGGVWDCWGGLGGSPLEVVWMGSVAKSMSTVPASAYATTSGGLQRYVAAVWGCALPAAGACRTADHINRHPRSCRCRPRNFVPQKLLTGTVEDDNSHVGNFKGKAMSFHQSISQCRDTDKLLICNWPGTRDPTLTVGS